MSMKAVATLPGTPAANMEPAGSRLKLLLYGDWKVGKTTACCQFPQSFFIDTEQGATQPQYVELMKKAEAHYFSTNEFDELLGAVRALLSTEHDRKTLVIDPISTVYTDLLETGERVKGDSWGKHYGYADQFMKRLFLLVDRLDMNVIVTSHAKPEYVGTGDAREATGKLTPDAWKKLPYVFDLIVELRRVGEKRVAEIRGSRLGQFTDGERFDWSYSEFAERLGAQELERLSHAVDLATEPQLNELEALFSKDGTTEEQRAKLLRRAKAASFEDCTAEIMDKIIAGMKRRVEEVK
jgi:hypothetical protein